MRALLVERRELIDDDRQREQREARAQVQPINFFSIGSSGSATLVASRKSGLGISSSLDQDELPTNQLA